MIPRISVIICTYNRCVLLKEALQSLLQQTADRSLYEIIIVDNNSTDDTGKIGNEFVSKNDNVRYIVETKQGLSHSRNLGFIKAKADWVAYIDDDARALNNYIARIIFIIENYDFDCFGGVYLPWYRDGQKKWFLDRYATNAQVQPKTDVLPANLYFSGGNSVFKKEVLTMVYGFCPDLGMTGTIISYGEETMLINRLRKLGHKIGFDPGLKIEHYVKSSQQTISWFFKSKYAHGRDSWKIFGWDVSMLQIAKLLVDIPLLPLLKLPNTLPRLFHRGYYLQNFIIDTFSQSAYALAQLIEGLCLLLKKNKTVRHFY